MDLPEAIRAIQPSVVQILVCPPVAPGSKNIVLGTGFLIHSEGYALTAKHVTRDASELLGQIPDSKLRAGLAIPNMTTPQVRLRGNFEILECLVIEEDQRHDLSLIRLQPNPFESGRPSGAFRTPEGGMGVNALYGLAATSQDVPVDGESIAVSGYPLQEPALVTTSGGIASAWGMDVKETQPPGAPAGFTVPDTADSYLADVAVNPGNSGGPVYRIETAEVIGVCVAFRIANAQADRQSNPFQYNSGLSVVVPIRYGLELLGRHV